MTEALSSFMQSVDELSDFVLFAKSDSRGVDNQTYLNSTIAFSEGAGWTYQQSGIHIQLFL